MKVLFVIALALVAVATAFPQKSYDTPAHYQYAYSVNDDASGNNYGASESRDGYSTQGEYHVLLPDGRIQTVTYSVADDQSGYVANVQYSGEPRYGPGPKYSA